MWGRCPQKVGSYDCSEYSARYRGRAKFGLRGLRRGRIVKDADALGTCYEDSASTLVDPFNDRFADWVLVHGRPVLARPPFARFGHAWLERGDTVFGVAAGSYVSRAVYYEAGCIEETERFVYTRDEARRQCATHGHWGPWEGLEAEEST